MHSGKALVWFRRDLRDNDHAALSAALAEAGQVYCAFIFDTEILDALPARQDRRVHFIRESLLELDKALRRRGGALIVRHGRAVCEIPRLASALGVSAVFANRDYEPAAKRRDQAVAAALRSQGIASYMLKDQAIFDQDEVLTQAGKPYTVFTPYRNAWLKRLRPVDCAPHPCQGQLAAPPPSPFPTLAELGFEPSDLPDTGLSPGMSGAQASWKKFSGEPLRRYGAQRDFPAIAGVSRLSVHLRFGTLSLREPVRYAMQAEIRTEAFAWLNELIWRDFHFMILDHFPHVAGQAFKPAGDALRWDDAPELFAAWCAGRTGYPLVDAAMRQLQREGWMHNRLRMLTASFLTKTLGIDWRRGEAYFAGQLLDFDLSANNGGWQWVASTGCDAQPFFRIFNPVSQSKKFDPEGEFIRRYVPELARLPKRDIHTPWQLDSARQAALGLTIGRDYPAPIVDLAASRQKTLARFAGFRAGKAS